MSDQVKVEYLVSRIDSSLGLISTVWEPRAYLTTEKDAETFIENSDDAFTMYTYKIDKVYRYQ